jgi:hypothetical protein
MTREATVGPVGISLALALAGAPVAPVPDREVRRARCEGVESAGLSGIVLSLADQAEPSRDARDEMMHEVTRLWADGRVERAMVDRRSGRSESRARPCGLAAGDSPIVRIARRRLQSPSVTIPATTRLRPGRGVSVWRPFCS